MNRLFGTDGVRGVANDFLTPEIAFALGRAGGYVLAAHGARRPVLVGRDTRCSGPMLEAALSAGLCSVGLDVWNVGIVPT
ncbi:MAG: phosphoglucosamine mutase, partial [Candidatus Eremiobacteraeota bacterium]|nr:phosphoglucosamine mutase [Candidatus Eremiobacteraeota bacterium]